MHVYPCIYTYMTIYTLVQTACAAYAYIYMQCMRPYNNRAHKPLDAAGSCSQHGIITQKNPPEATEGFYQETTQ